jgi:DNA helicase-2/ATP-dependent DNA helicase PcrA
MSTYVDIPAASIREYLLNAGFVRATDVRGREEVYDLIVADASMTVVRVYSSIAVGRATARGCGEDAIRVVAVDVASNRGVFKGRRIHRTGSVEKVLARIGERITEAKQIAARKGATTMTTNGTTNTTTVQDDQEGFDAFLAPVAAMSVEKPAPAKTLNAEQQSVVAHVSGPCVVQAVAGCGKTHAVVERIAALVKSGVAGETILAVTFSKKAADEMNARLVRLGIVTARIGTWHALCLQILKDDATEWGRWPVDEKDRAKTILKEALGYKNLKWTDADFGKVRRFIGRCKANLWAWDSAEAMTLAQKEFGGRNSTMAVRAYELSDSMIHASGLLTFDDMLVFVNRHLSIEDNRVRWAAKWAYMIVDEFQDNNRAQSEIGRALVQDHRNYMVVGDCAQSIYAFRGSSPEHIMRFEAEWTAARVAMVRNYRSGRAIVAAANAIIRPAAVRMPEEMVAERDLDGKVTALRVPTFDSEGAEIVRWVQASGQPLRDHCILFRTNAQSRAIEEALLKAKMPYVLVGGSSFYERKEVKDLLGYLRVAAGVDRDGDAVRRCINAPFRFLGKAFVERVMDLARQPRDGIASFWPTVVREAASQAGVQQRQRSSAEQWAMLVEQVCEMMTPQMRVTKIVDQVDGTTEVMREERPDAILNHIINRTDFIRALEKDEGEESVESSAAANVREMIRVASAFQTVKELLEYVATTIAAATKQRKDGQAGGERVTLMSVHRSKGLEWPRVWVVGCNEQILPHAKGDIEEERRLMYVAATRARDELVLSYVSEFATRSGVKDGIPSRFLIDAGLVIADGGDA